MENLLPTQGFIGLRLKELRFPEPRVQISRFLGIKNHEKIQLAPKDLYLGQFQEGESLQLIIESPGTFPIPNHARVANFPADRSPIGTIFNRQQAHQVSHLLGKVLAHILVIYARYVVIGVHLRIVIRMRGFSNFPLYPVPR